MKIAKNMRTCKICMYRLCFPTFYRAEFGYKQVWKDYCLMHNSNDKGDNWEIKDLKETCEMWRHEH